MPVKNLYLFVIVNLETIYNKLTSEEAELSS